MDFNAVINELQLGKYRGLIGECWENSAAVRVETDNFLDPQKLSDNMKKVQIPDEDHALILQVAASIRDNEALFRLAEHAYWTYAISDYPQCKNINEWPSLTHSLPQGNGIFYLLIVLQAVPQMIQAYTKQNLEESLIFDTIENISRLNKNHHVATGLPGIIHQQIHWTRNYVDGKLYRLGRMEYMAKRMNDKIRVFRHKQHGHVIAMVKKPSFFAEDGMVRAPANSLDVASLKQTHYREDKEYVEAYPVSPDGRIFPEPMTINLADWKKVLGENDWCIDMHIPAGGGMRPELCRDSMRKAFQFFPQHFPDRRFSAIVCESWIFNTQFEELLPRTNIAEFMQEVYLFPVPSDPYSGFFFVFCKNPEDYDDLSQAPRDTSMRRAMLEVLTTGRKLRKSGMFFLPEEMEKYGTKVYRNQWKQIIEQKTTTLTKGAHHDNTSTKWTSRRQTG